MTIKIILIFVVVQNDYIVYLVKLSVFYSYMYYLFELTYIYITTFNFLTIFSY